MVTTGDLTIKKSLSRGLKLASLQSQIPVLQRMQFFSKYLLSDMENMVDDIITRRRSETGEVQRDLLQLILDANKEDPAFFTERRVREELKLFMCVESPNYWPRSSCNHLICF
jgi:hypothetical protein